MRLRAGSDLSDPVVDLREAWLWEQFVLIDDAGDVWCSGCQRTLPFAELLRWDSPHRVRPPAMRNQLSRTSPLEFRAVEDSDRQPPMPWWGSSW